MTIPFARTTCACADDVANCKRKPGMLAPDDLAPITQRLVEMGLADSPEDAKQYLRASPGATVARYLPTGGIKIARIPTIVPMTRASGACFFLTPINTCAIHDVAPAGCRFFDVHQDPKEGLRRSTWIHTEIATNLGYTAFRATLQEKD